VADSAERSGRRRFGDAERRLRELGLTLTQRTGEDRMPGLISRTMTIIKAKYSKLLDRTENPAETLDYSYEQQLQQLQNVKRGIADVATAKKRLEIQYTTMQSQSEKLDGQAKAALQANREDLAREALTRKAAIQGQLDGIMQSGQQLEAQQQKLQESEKALALKIEQFRTQKEVIKAQYSAAEAQVRIGEAATGISNQMSDVGLAVQRAKDKTESMQARANAIEELTASGALDDFTSPSDDIDRELKQIQQSGQVDDELAKLKAELGGGEQPKEIEGAEAPSSPEPAVPAPTSDPSAADEHAPAPAPSSTESG
jgi:phage shock protein A